MTKSKSQKKADEPARKRPRVAEETAHEDEESEEEEEESEESQEPLNLEVDEDGRVCNTSGPLTSSISFHPPVRVYDDFVSAGSVAVLRDCCEQCFSAKPSKGEYCRGRTFWADWGQSARCDLEALALAILWQHCPEPAAAAGVEWWILCMDSHADLGWHWDRDYSLEDDGVNIHPMLGTITYLSAATSPPHVSTIALDVLSPVARDEVHPVSILGGTAACIMVPPKPGRHFVFDGRFLHGAPHRTAKQVLPNANRVTFQANIWVGHKPSTASPLPLDMQVWSRQDLGSQCTKSILSASPALVNPVESPVAPAMDFSLEGGTLKVGFPISPSAGAEMSVSCALAAASWSRRKQKGKKGKAASAVKGKVMKDGARGPELDIIIVGAGACGVGVGMALAIHFGISRDRMLLLERGTRVGTSFRLWPKEMRFISPSFNQQGWTDSFDLNSIAAGTSPATLTSEEHPTGEQYANYLERVARDASLPIRFGVDVRQILPVGSAGQPQFDVHVQSSTSSHDTTVQSCADSVNSVLRCRFVIWAAGEFQYPKRSCGFPGAELCRHNSTVHSWAAHPGEEFIVIGGYESGIDAAVNLASSNRVVTVLASSPCWEETSCDPSSELAPYTRARLKHIMTSQYSSKLQLFGGARVTKVKYDCEKYFVHATLSGAQQGDAEQTNTADKCSEQEAVYVTPSPPILCVGFEGSVSHLVKDMFDWEHAKASNTQACNGDAAHKVATCGSAGSPCLTEEDESTKTQGLFLVGPQVSHEGLVFCFVYKFRQRFAVVAAAVANRLGKDTRLGVSACRSAGMFLDDFAGIHACCGEQSGHVSIAANTGKLKKKPSALVTPKAALTLQKKPAGAAMATKKLIKKPAGSTTKGEH